MPKGSKGSVDLDASTSDVIMILLRKNPIFFVCFAGLALYGLSMLFFYQRDVEEDEKPKWIDNPDSPFKKKNQKKGKKQVVVSSSEGSEDSEENSESEEEEVKVVEKKPKAKKQPQAKAAPAPPAEKVKV